MALEFKKKAKIVIFVDSILFVYLSIVLLICQRVFWNEIVYGMAEVGIKTTAQNINLILLACYGLFAVVWQGLVVLLYKGIKERNPIKLLVWSILHFVLLVPYTISAVFAIFYSYKFIPALLYVIYRGFMLWVVNGLNPEIMRQRRQPQRICYV